jgi:hypothetical protein
MFTRRSLTSLANLALALMLLLGTIEALGPRTRAEDAVPAAHTAPAVQVERPAQDHVVFLPLVANNYFTSPGDDLIVSWTQLKEGGERKVLLHWREPVDSGGATAADGAAVGYNVYRRQAGAADWHLIGTTSFATDVATMVAILGSDLTEQLGYDLRLNANDAPLTPQEIYDRLQDDPGIRQLVAGQYYQVGQATGTVYLDPNVVIGSDVEYRVERVGGGHGEFTPVFVPDDDVPTLPTPTGLSAVWTGPAALGVRPSSRPDDAAERYDWFGTQPYRAWDGTVYLIWDVPAQGVGNEGEVWDAYNAANLAGYRVYRAPHGTQSWESVNPTKADCTASKLYCEMLVGLSSQADTEDFPAYFFKEDLRKVYTDPAQIYTQWDYKVCPVDRFHHDAPCSTALTVDVRELQPPAPVSDAVIALDSLETQTQLQLTWTYSDTQELSAPLRFYVTRSPTLTLPAEQWTPIFPQGSTDPYQQVSTTGPVTLHVVDAPPKDQAFWYRVQVRDNAGNWSAPGPAVKGALYDRTDPTLPTLPYDPAECANNPLPFTLTGLSDDVMQLALYRGFDPGGPWQLIKRITVSGGAAEIDDDYVPPYDTDVYYQIEAVDGHGNVSDPLDYCANLSGAPVSPPAPPMTATMHYPPDGDPYWEVEIDEGVADSDALTSTIRIRKPGEDGGTKSTQTFTDTVTGSPPMGGWTEIGTFVTGELVGMSSTFWLYETNNFLGVNRQLTDLHDLYDTRWMTDTFTGEHYVQLRVVPLDGYSPPMAVFRRIPGGNWMQIDNVKLRWNYTIEDHSDPSPGQAYEYVVLLLGPETYEVLGYWGPAQVDPLVPAPDTSHLSLALSPATGAPAPDCSYTRTSAKSLGMPNSIALANGWAINGVYYWVSSDHDCPTAMASFDADHAYGDGNLYDGKQEWPIEFYDIGVHTTGVHKTGRVVGTLNKNLVATASRFAATFGDIEFEPGTARAEVTMTLPANIAFDFPETDRTGKLFAVVDNVTTDYSFDPIPLDSDTILIDENLPWELHSSAMAIDGQTITFGAHATAVDRLDYTPDDHQPDNNLAFLRATYTSSDATVSSQGLDGSFHTGDAISYTASFPAWIEVQAAGGASVTIADSTIAGGMLDTGSASLAYMDFGMHSEYAAYHQDCDGQPIAHYAICNWITGVHERRLNMTPVGTGDAITIGAGGILTAPMTLDQTPLWPKFEVDTHSVTLYIAAAVFPDDASSWAPMPAENAWLELPHPTGGTIDPGININALHQRINYTFYDPPNFDDSDMDLYVRRAGVSGHLIINGDDTQRVNDHGYQATVHYLEFGFVDNALWQLSPGEVDLYLPYPTDKTFLLYENVYDPLTNQPVSGDFRETTVALHKYWNFTETPTTWEYVGISADYGTSLGAQSKLFALLGSRATITGLGPLDEEPGSASTELAFASEWLPSGDIGALRLFPPDEHEYLVSGFDFAFTGVHLSRYYRDPLHPSSLPDTVGIDVGNSLDSLPEQMLDSGGNLTGQSLKACSAGDTIGCGFVVLDGNVAVDYFGEVQPEGTAHDPMMDTAVSTVGVSDVLSGTFPVAVNQCISVTKQVAVLSGRIPWMWPLVNQVLDVNLPVKFLGNTQGGALVALQRNATVFPDQALFNTDVAAIITMDWSGASGAQDKFGVFLGAPASQAAFRALAMNRPTWTGGVLPYTQWRDVQADIGTWSAKFGYIEGPGAEDDPVDLAQTIWDDWGAMEFDMAYRVVEPVLVSRAQNGQDDAYGVTGLEPGAGLMPAHASMNNGAMAATFRLDGVGYQMTSLEGGTQMAYDVWEYDLYVTDIDVFLELDWVSAEMNRDGEVTFKGDPYMNLIGDIGVNGSFFGMAYPEGDEWRIEGSVDMEPIGLAGVAALDLAGEFGSGPYEGEMVSYLSVRGEGYYLNYRVGGGVLYGAIYDSPFLRDAGYGELLDTLGDENTYTGLYLYLDGSFPFVDSDTCLLEASAAGSIRIWYYWSDDLYGGTLSAAVHATVACIISGRGQLDLEYAHLDNGGKLLGRTCNSANCDAYGGGLWVAVGVGWCSPSSWHRWQDRWWGDSWCYTFGAYVNMSYFDPGGLDYEADFDYE